jgi:carbamoyl-phosphate synthase large subunit
MTSIDPWFLYQLKEINDMQLELEKHPMESIPDDVLREAKRMGFSDGASPDLALDGKGGQEKVRHFRKKHGLKPVYKRVDTCAAEFESYTPYLYSTYEEEDEAAPTAKKKVVILGSGPNRIGQGIEFDYCCCHASYALREDGYETIMINCNPETVSTDYDTSDRLYFEPLTLEDVFAVCEHEASAGAPVGVIVQFGGQTPLNLSLPLKAAGVNIIGTTPESSIWPKTASASANCSKNSTSRRLPAPWSPRWKKRSKPRRKLDSRCWCVPPMCSAGAPWSSPTTKTRFSNT